MTDGATDPRVLTVTRPTGTPAPLVLDSPHSGTSYPPDFAAIAPLRALQRAQDTYVDELFGAAPDHGAVLLVAGFPRTYIDPNRPLDDLDPDLLDGAWPEPLHPSEKSMRGSGLIWRLCPPGNVAIYDRKLGIAEVERRIERFWRPYHDALGRTLDRLHEAFGYVLHVNCHSMHSISSGMHREGPGFHRPDVVLGDREGRSCSREVTTFVQRWCEAEGLSVAINDPYKGVELVRAYSDPGRGRDCLQIEINRRLYLNEISLEPSQGFERTRDLMTRMVEALAGFATQKGRRRTEQAG